MDDDFCSPEEEEALAEIKRALNIQDPEPPPTTISIPRRTTKNLASPSSDNSPVTSMEPVSMDRTSVTESYDDNELTKLSTTSMEGTFSGGAFDSNASTPKFYIGRGGVTEDGENRDGEDEESSVRSRVSLVEAEEMSYNELLGLVERLYDHLKQADKALTKEQERRVSREKSLIKLAKELKNRKAKISDCMEQIEELEEELQVARSERALLEQRLDTLMEYSERRKDESRQALKFALAEATEKYRTASLEHELRIQEVNRCHADQCEQLCREVIQANREISRLRKKNAELSSMPVSSGGRGVDRAQYGTSSRDGEPYLSQTPPSSNRSNRSARKPARRRGGIILLMAIFVFFVGLRPPGHWTTNIMRLPIVWKDFERKTDDLLRPLFVSFAFMQPKSKSEIGLSKRKASARVSVGPSKRKASYRGVVNPVGEASLLAEKKNQRDPTGYSPSINVPPQAGTIADKFFSPFLKLKSRIGRLFGFLKGIIRTLVEKGRETTRRRNKTY